MPSVLSLLSSRARTADQTLALLGILFFLRRIDNDFCYNLLSFLDTLDDFGVHSVGLYLGVMAVCCLVAVLSCKETKDVDFTK